MLYIVRAYLCCQFPETALEDTQSYTSTNWQNLILIILIIQFLLKPRLIYSQPSLTRPTMVPILNGPFEEVVGLES